MFIVGVMGGDQVLNFYLELNLIREHFDHSWQFSGKENHNCLIFETETENVGSTQQHLCSEKQN